MAETEVARAPAPLPDTTVRFNFDGTDAESDYCTKSETLHARLGYDSRPFEFVTGTNVCKFVNKISRSQLSVTRDVALLDDADLTLYKRGEALICSEETTPPHFVLLTKNDGYLSGAELLEHFRNTDGDDSLTPEKLQRRYREQIMTFTQAKSTRRRSKVYNQIFGTRVVQVDGSCQLLFVCTTWTQPAKTFSPALKQLVQQALQMEREGFLTSELVCTGDEAQRIEEKLGPLLL